jgi:AcrR family transcriptional regulator
MAATAEVVAEHGYAAAGIAEISARAGVSPKTFYEHFATKLDCFLAGYDTLIEVLYARMGADMTPQTGWHEFIVSSVSGYLATLDANPAVARAFLVEIDAAGPVARQRRRQAYRQFADMVKAQHETIRERDPRLGPLPDRVYMAIVHGVRELVCDALEENQDPRLTDLGPDIFLWITAAIRGAATATRELHRTPAAQRLLVGQPRGGG